VVIQEDIEEDNDEMTFGECWQCGKADSLYMTGFGHCEEHEPNPITPGKLEEVIARAEKAEAELAELKAIMQERAWEKDER
jgi:hypothetical protein